MVEIIWAIVLSLFLANATSCSKSKTDDLPSLDNTQIAETYRAEGSLADIPRCDGATFLTHAKTVGVQNIDINVLENPPGRINRDVKPCFPNDSASEASREMVIGWLHWIWTEQNKDLALDRLIAFGEQNEWVMGQGPSDLVDMKPLAPMAYLMRQKLTGQSLGGVDIDSTLSGFKGHVLGSYLWLAMRVQGNMGPTGKEGVHQLYQANPADPMYTALWHRITDGNQTETYDILSNRNTFPNNPTHETGMFGWGSCPDWLYFLIVDGIVRGT